MNNVVTVLFDVDSEAYQAFAGLRAHTVDPAYLVSEAVLIAKEDGHAKIVESVDTGANTTDDTAAIDARFEEIKAKHEADRAEFAEAAADAVAEAEHAQDKVFGE